MGLTDMRKGTQKKFGVLLLVGFFLYLGCKSAFVELCPRFVSTPPCHSSGTDPSQAPCDCPSSLDVYPKEEFSSSVTLEPSSVSIVHRFELPLQAPIRFISSLRHVTEISRSSLYPITTIRLLI